MTTFNLLGGLAYLLVMAAAGLAASQVDARLRRTARGNALLHWWGIAALFAGLAAWRLGMGEANVQEWARAAAKAEGGYADRRVWQGQLMAATLLIGAACAWRLARTRGESPRIRASRFAALALLGYTAVRTLSFHPVDAVIYARIGPISINHVLDTALAVIVGTCALHNARRAKNRSG